MEKSGEQIALPLIIVLFSSEPAQFSADHCLDAGCLTDEVLLHEAHVPLGEIDVVEHFHRVMAQNRKAIELRSLAQLVEGAALGC